MLPRSMRLLKNGATIVMTALGGVAIAKSLYQPRNGEKPTIPAAHIGAVAGSMSRTLYDVSALLSDSLGHVVSEEDAAWPDSIPNSADECIEGMHGTLQELRILLTSKRDQENTQEDSKESMIKLTRLFNSLATTCSYVGFLASGGQGMLRAVLPDNRVPALANDVLMSIARFFYNAGSSSRSYVREETTDPNKRQNLDARAYAEASNMLSIGSLIHGAFTMAAILLPKSRIQALPERSHMLVALKYLRGPGFNMTGFLGILAAVAYTVSEKIETEELIDNGVDALKRRHASIAEKLVSDDELRKIVKAQVPHLTDDEYYAKNAAYFACAVAALGGLGGAVPILASRYAKVGQVLGQESVSKMAEIGGRMNGIFYASWPLFVTLTHESYNSEERRLPEHMEGMWNDLRKQAAMESAGIVALTLAALVTFYKAPDKSKLKRISDIILNKMDVIAGGVTGSLFLGAAAMREKTPSSYEEMTELVSDSDKALVAGMQLNNAGKGLLLEMLEAPDSPHRATLLAMMREQDSPVSRALKGKSQVENQLQAMLENKDTAFSTLLQAQKPSFWKQCQNMFEENPLLLSGFFARSVWVGPRMGILSAVAEYVERTNDALYSREEQLEYLRDLARKLPKKAVFPNVDIVSYGDLRNILEYGSYEKDDPNNEMASKGIPNKRPLCPAAFYAAQMLRELETKEMVHEAEKTASARAAQLRAGEGGAVTAAAPFSKVTLAAFMPLYGTIYQQTAGAVRSQEKGGASTAFR